MTSTTRLLLPTRYVIKWTGDSIKWTRRLSHHRKGKWFPLSNHEKMLKSALFYLCYSIVSFSQQETVSQSFFPNRKHIMLEIGDSRGNFQTRTMIIQKARHRLIRAEQIPLVDSFKVQAWRGLLCGRYEDYKTDRSIKAHKSLIHLTMTWTLFPRVSVSIFIYT